MFDEHDRTLREQRALGEDAWRCPCLLVAAERARLLGQDTEAQRLYNQAIDLAQQDGFVRFFALGNELYGRFSARRGFDRLARLCLSDAYQGWLSWGARARADALAAQLPRYFVPVVQQQGNGQTPTTKGTATVALQGVLLDLGEAMRAAHAISSEILADRVIEQFLRASAASTAVGRAFVIMADGDDLSIAGRLTTKPDMQLTLSSEPLAATAQLAASVVRYVARSREVVILGDGDQAGQFIDDPFIRQHRPKSLLCFPLVHQDRLLGVWYAESETLGDLRRGSVELLRMLASQAASALDNARLYGQLRSTSGQLSEKNERLQRELEERERIERERSALQELLLEVSTPLIPISERVIVVPIVGTISERRAGHMLETVLAGVHERRARALIVDVTGLREVDAATLRILLKMASALRLLGVQVILTGVRPDVATTLVGMDVSMKDLVVRSTLQAGIAFAMTAPQGR